MGRYAQSKLRGGHVGNQVGLPAGPLNGDWHIIPDAPDAEAEWLTLPYGGWGYWRSRWRSPESSMTWQDSGDPVQAIAIGNQQYSPQSYVPGHPLQAEVAFCDAAGIVLSQWSAFQQIS